MRRAARQFLPQDKVASFAQLRPGELLLETERAIGDASLHKLHLELIESRSELANLERVCARAHLYERGLAAILLSDGVHLCVARGPGSIERVRGVRCWFAGQSCSGFIKAFMSLRPAMLRGETAEPDAPACGKFMV